ncbi:HAMP domain-containing histidine kinase [Limosilactobacillus fermentum]|uniref:sensor histidine kinase n=1 Tax=Limosilactobacillus fermentum TaxID=1613 RepID=UPI00019C667C|nr:HAMP domain-containing sensor histidine kinase [Limosilactobacillus fermentum]EEI22728.1 ATPase/histidine kinase/DNA gyrase B/HSP90 domain protein [Limosilactobacillus fermentum ATCC 14931]MCH5403358.1 HAMP domain-containing histidine kinase [Limosilactobacillus fermentum]MDC6124717.1 HAMP domain-containing sensor histidine kinase [Limosilactobacillus fermentum]MDG9736147.1 HAMP domain-containing sensor histidine kinase [Limosilactobacillus fermentum]QCJ26820.1 HAMP domain-containing histid
MLKLTGREKSSLFFEGLLTIILLGLINIALITIIQTMIQSNPGVQSGIFIIKQSLVIGPFHAQIWSYQRIVMALLVLIDIGVLWWRLLRRYHLYQLDHIIGELHYIAQGHLEHRIPFRVNGNQQHVITSVNALVDTITQAMQEERASEKSKDELITNVSHDLRTPLTSIIGYLGLIEDHQYQSEEDIVKYSHIAYDKAKQMKNLVEDLFEYTKVQQHGAPVNLMTVDLGQLLEQVGASFELEADKKGMAINVTCEPSPLSITADPEKLGRLFSNLVANALKYGHGASYIHLTAKQLGEKVVITVADDGEKIPAESVKHLFERFYRVESSRNKATGGTGLGLAIVQSIVELHHGSVTARSDDQETAFVVTLPVKQVQKEVR